METAQTIAGWIHRRAEDDAPALYFEDQCWSYRQYVAHCAARAAWLGDLRQPGPFNVGILLDNVPEFPFWLGACAVAGATMVGLNATRRGADLIRDIEHTHCQWVITDQRYVAELADLPETVLARSRIIIIDAADYQERLAAFNGRPLPADTVTPGDIFSLIFTSGSTGAPKACICSHGRIATLSSLVGHYFGYDRTAVSYVPMPWFHAGAINMGWLPALAGGSAVVIGKFTVSGFLPTVRRYGATHFNYVGKPLAYLLTAPEQADDADNTLRVVHGNEGAIDDQERFAARFGCRVVDGYGSTEGGVSITRTPEMPRGCLGVSLQPGVKVMNPETGQECPRARFDSRGELLNANDAIGELVNVDGAEGFEGYWNNPDANHKRVHDGIFWSGDLAYRDEQGFFWFAGRDDDWMRVDGENIASAQVEQVLFRHPDVVVAGVYAVPDHQVGDRVMAALQLRDDSSFDPLQWQQFLDAQSDFGTKWFPRFVRITRDMPMTATAKVMRRQLRLERWQSDDPIWWQEHPGEPLQRMDQAAKARYEASFAGGAQRLL